MTDSEKKIIEDIRAFLKWAIENDKEFLWALSNVGHDVNGIFLQVPAFLPRTTGYSDRGTSDGT